MLASVVELGAAKVRLRPKNDILGQILQAVKRFQKDLKFCAFYLTYHKSVLANFQL